ncbi:MAG: hypothetical protein QM674_22760 [Burkholderiaceae bacterium]
MNIAEDALLAARHLAQRKRLPLGEAMSELIRRGAAAREGTLVSPTPALRGRFALLPVRDEIITPAHVRELMDRENI